MAGLFLVAVGTAAAVWTLQVALSGSSVNAYRLLFGRSLMAQSTSWL